MAAGAAVAVAGSTVVGADAGDPLAVAFASTAAAISHRHARRPVSAAPGFVNGERRPRGAGAASSWQLGATYTLGRAVAVLALVLLAPLMVAIAIAVRVSSPGPVLVRQRRVGLDGIEFEILTYRSMAGRPTGDPVRLVPGSAPGGVEGTERRTRVGRWLRATSLDELPQLINVVRGELALIGPRPERPEFVALFTDQYPEHDARHRMKAATTRWAHAKGLRGQTPIADWVRRRPVLDRELEPDARTPHSRARRPGGPQGARQRPAHPPDDRSRRIEADRRREVAACVLGQPYPGVSLGGEVGEGSDPRPGPVNLDPAPLTDPALFAPDERRAIIDELVESTRACIEEMGRHLDAADLPAVRRAAHWARNSALTVGAGDLARALEAVESACRGDDLPLTRRAAAALPELWQATRTAIAEIRDGGS